MDISAKELLESRNMMLSRRLAIQATIESAQAHENRRANEKIAEMALGRRQPDGMPRAGGPGDSTQSIALSYRERAMRETRDEIESMKSELGKVDLIIALYDAAMEALNVLERRLVHLHYDEAQPFCEIADRDLIPNRPTAFSASTIKRMNQTILRKVDAVLGSKGNGHAPGGAPSEGQRSG